MICCDFCGKSEHQAEAIIAAERPGDKGNVAICDSCAESSAQMAESKKRESKTEKVCS
ncbi:ClpX C4-type zinc finger protein [Halomonas colorata]|uniref:ClpX C4-type zinc finger protein n=1 Tax=Halomonas colorata TaxID=2742615 RepID=UPI0018677B00